MSDAWDTLKLLADPTRLRIICLLQRSELSVNELQEILDMGQSRISSHLGLLRGGGMLNDRKDGKRTYYTLSTSLEKSEESLISAACSSAKTHPDLVADLDALERLEARRNALAEKYFTEVASRLGKNYCPGRSWEAIGHFLLLLTPSIEIADLGAGEGMIGHLLARRAKHVHCIDNNPKMVEVGTELARKHDIANLTYHVGDIEDVPLKNKSVHLALLSQALHHAEKPERAITEAYRILKPGGRIAVLDLRNHAFEKARELYADRWLGFADKDLHHFLNDAGFSDIEVTPVSREEKEPYFTTLLATAVR